MPAALAPLALPVAPGTLSKATNSVIVVDYGPDADKAALGAAWTAALTAGGYTVGEPHGDDLAKTWDVSKGTMHPWTLIVLTMGGHVRVHLDGAWGA